jgi:hypothetical protein
MNVGLLNRHTIETINALVYNTVMESATNEAVANGVFGGAAPAEMPLAGPG